MKSRVMVVKIRLNPLFVALWLAAAGLPLAAVAEGPWWSDAAEKALGQSGTNRAEIVSALEKTPAAQRGAMQFLVENMPEPDLQTLSAKFLLENVALATEAYEKSPWRDQVSPEMFYNEILPYSSVNERRDDWRKLLREKCLPMVADCKTPGEAAQRINEKLFKLTNVKYSTARKKADQSALETMDSGLASCTGLSILLIDGCRSVGVPVRFAGTPMWVNERGNHSWVEVWDGKWHFVGAAEPDPKGLDHAWFEHDASQAVKDKPRYSIYATSFKKTGLAFPMDWAPRLNYVSAENVTDNYTPKSATAAAPEAGKIRVLVKVLDQLAGKRVAAKVTVTELTNSAAHFEGTSRTETADMNDILPFDLPKGKVFQIRAEQDGMVAGRDFGPVPMQVTNQQTVVVIAMKDTVLPQFPSQMCYAPPPVTEALKSGDETKLKNELAEYFATPADKRAAMKFSSSLDKLLRDNEPAVRSAAWEAYKAAPIHEELKKDFDAKQATFEKQIRYVSPYTVKTVGKRPANGWPLFIAMHGGGNAPKELNDSQWKHMQIYYTDHPEVGGYKYVALRAPNDTWNGFYDDYVYPLVANLIREFTIFGDVDVNKVFIMGYSHGGYGAFAIGPKEPDLFAAIHASAAAPTDGETTGKTLRNTIFTVMVGEKDTDYGRFERDQKFTKSIDEFRGSRKDIYPVTVQFIPNNGHTGLPDHDKIKEMYPAVRNPVPRDLTWLMTDKVIRDFFWLHTDAPAKKQEIDAVCQDNQIKVTTTTDVTSATLMLDARLVDFKKPVTVELNGASSTQKIQPSVKVLCDDLLRRGDPELAFTAEIKLPLAKAAAK
jgi:transglutaminase-like putative cysteine protease